MSCQAKKKTAVGVTDSDGVRCLIFKEDVKTKTNQGDLDRREVQPRTTFIYENPKSEWCPLRLFEKYCALLPPNGEKPDFYLHPMTKPTLSQWYSDRPIGINTLHCTMKRLVDSAGFEGRFSNHSLRASSATRLYQAGCPEKLIKEVTGHRSKAVRDYQCTPNLLKCAVSEMISKALSKFKVPKMKPNVIECNKPEGMSLEDCIKQTGINEMTKIMRGVDQNKVKKVSVQIDVEYEEK